MDQLDKLEAFVLNRFDGSYFAYCRSFPKDLIIAFRYVPNDVDIFGKWIQVVVREENVVCQPIRIIDDLFESRIFHGIPQVKVQIRYDEPNNDGVPIFKNGYFGNVSDFAGFLKDVHRDAVYNVWIERHKEPEVSSRWRVSRTQDNVFPINSQSIMSSLQTVEGIIHSVNNNSYIAWSKERPFDRIFIDLKYCSDEDDLVGKWVEMEIDQNLHAAAPVVVINELFKTRVKTKVVEINVDFESVRNSPEPFYHRFFGNICDTRHLMDRVEIGAVYRGWIVYHQMGRNPHSRWRLATDQIISGPLNYTTGQRNNIYHDGYYGESRRETNSSRRCNDRSPSPDIINNYHNGDYHDSRQSDCFSPGRRYSTDQEYDRAYRNSPNYHDGHDRRSYNDRGGHDNGDEQDFVAHRNDNDYNEQYSSGYHLDRQGHQRRRSRDDMDEVPNRYPRSRSRSMERFDNRPSSSASRLDNVETHVAQISKSIKPASPESAVQSEQIRNNDRAPTSDSEDESGDERENANILFRRYADTQETSDQGRSSNQQDTQTADARTQAGSRRAKVSQLPPEEKKIALLKEKLGRVRRYFEFFSANEDIVEKMKLLGLEEYEELAETIKKV